MVIAVLSGLLMFIGLLLIIANLLYVGYVWEKELPLYFCNECCEPDYVFYSILSTMGIIGIFMLPPANLLIVPVLVGVALLIAGMVGLVKLGQRLAHVGFTIKTKKEDE